MNLSVQPVPAKLRCEVGQASACQVLSSAIHKPKPDRLNRLRKKALFCHSERSEESLFDSSASKKQGEILRFAQNYNVSLQMVGFSAHATIKSRLPSSEKE